MGKIGKAGRKVKEKLKKAKHHVSKTVKPGFWKKVILTLHPKTYSELSGANIRTGFNYILALLFASFIIMGVLAMPKLISMPDYINSELSKFDKLNITIDAEMKSPVKLTEEDPQIVIDTTDEITEIGSEKVLITEHYLFYRPYGRTRAYNISEFSEITSKKEEVSRLLTFLAIILLPTILLTAYIMFLIKYIITIAAVSLLLFVVIRLVKKDLGMKKALNTAIYAATPMILLEVIFIPFNSKYLIQIFQLMGMNFYLIPLLIYVILAGFGSYFALKKSKGKKGEEYPEMEKVEWDF